MPARKLTRRRFLGGLAIAASGAVAATGLASCRPALSDAETLLLELVSQVAVPDPVAVGQAYLRDHRDEHDAAVLLDRVFAGLPVAGGGRRLLASFRDRLSDDFEHRRTVRADGWILSRTEARFCALLALDPRRR